MRSQRRKEKIRSKARGRRNEVLAEKVSKVQGKMKAIEARLKALENKGGPGGPN